MGPPAQRVTVVLDLVSLTGTEADRRVANYSLGMRQRLGLAVALIGHPTTLIRDEPANGLDPAGIRWMRDLLRDFAGSGGTVLLSTHLLHEIEIVAGGGGVQQLALGALSDDACAADDHDVVSFACLQPRISLSDPDA